MLQAVEEEVRRRRFGEVVRLEVASDMEPRLREVLVDSMKLDEQQVYDVKGLIGIDDTVDMVDVRGFGELRYAPWQGVTPPRLRQGRTEREVDVLAAMRDGDILVHHPYDSFSSSVVRVRAPGRRGPERARAEADRLPDQRGLSARPGAGRGDRARQAGRLPGGAEGALRRERQHRLGEVAGGGRRARRLRHPRDEDPRQVRARLAPRRGRSPQLRPHRNRQLQPEDRPHLHRHRALHCRPRHRGRHRRDVQLPDRLREAERVSQAAGRPLQPEGGDHQRDRPHDRRPLA